MAKKMNKAVAAILAGAMSTALLAGCGSGSSESASQDASASSGTEAAAESTSSGNNDLVMAWWGNQVRNERTQAALDKYHELNPDITVEGQFFQWTDYWQKLATASAGDALPDVIQMDYQYIDQYVQNGQLLDLTPYIESGALDVSNIPDNILEMGKIGDGNYGIAAGVTGSCLFYNKTATDEAGIEIKQNMTMDEFKEIAQEMADTTGYRVRLFQSGSYLTEWLRGEGTPFTEAKLPVDNAEDLIPYFQLHKDGIDNGWHLTPDLMTSTGVEDSPLVYGSSPETMAWCVMDGSSNMLTSFQSAAADGVEIALMTIPTSDPKKSNYLKPAMYFSVSASTKDPDAAVALLNYLINSEDANNILLGERGVPASTTIAELVKSQVSETDQAAMAYVTDVITPNCSAIDPPNPDGWSEVSSELGKIQEAVEYGQTSVEDAAQQLYDKCAEIWGN